MSVCVCTFVSLEVKRLLNEFILLASQMGWLGQTCGKLPARRWHAGNEVWWRGKVWGVGSMGTEIMDSQSLYVCVLRTVSVFASVYLTCGGILWPQFYALSEFNREIMTDTAAQHANYGNFVCVCGCVCVWKQKETASGLQNMHCVFVWVCASLMFGETFLTINSLKGLKWNNYENINR